MPEKGLKNGCGEKNGWFYYPFCRKPTMVLEDTIYGTDEVEIFSRMRSEFLEPSILSCELYSIKVNDVVIDNYFFLGIQ